MDSIDNGADNWPGFFHSSLTQTQIKIIATCDEISKLLVNKNRKYGNSAIDPIRIFSQADSEEQIKVRIDDKLNRIRNLQPDETEDTIDDLIGYLILLKIKRQENKKVNQ
jgi:hypothetical protein